MIPDHLVDVELSFAGWLESEEDRTFGTDFPDSLLIDRSEWRDRIAERERAGHSLADYHPYVFDQSVPTHESSCVYNSACGCMMIRRNIQLGIKRQVILSPMSGYCRVARHRHSGSTMWGALEQASEVGFLPSDQHADDYKHTWRENGPFNWPSALPEGWRETAKLFRCTEWLRIDSREQFASSLLGGMPICYGRNGHSICAEDLCYSEGRFLVRYCDSYGLGRGEQGRLYDSERYWATGGAWACRVVTMPDEIF